MAGQVIVVFGGAGLIGRAIVDAIANAGGVAVIASRSAGRRAIQTKVSGTSPRRGLAASIRVDVTSPRSLERALKTVHGRHGRITGIINCTLPKGPGYGRRFEDVAFDDFCHTVNAHLGGAFLVCQHAVRYFSAHGGGTIVNFASVYGFLPPRFEIYDGTNLTKEIEYVVSKAGIIQLTAYLGQYLKKTNIRVNCISPGGVFDNQDPRFVERYNRMCWSKGMLDPSDIVGTVLFLLSDQSRHICGQNIVVDDGFSL